MESKYLVVDDSLTVVHAARSLLERDRGDRERILTAHTASEAMELFEEYRPETVLLDIDLPDMGGHELAKDLKEVDPSARIVMVTGLTLEDERVRTVLDDLDVDFLEKPVEARDLADLGLGAGADQPSQG